MPRTRSSLPADPRALVFALSLALASLLTTSLGCIKTCANGGACPQQTHEGRGADTPVKPECVTYAPIVCLGDAVMTCTKDSKGCEICTCDKRRDGM